ncbi:MAG TPA: hypothetical protein PK109_02980 [Candidatus Paceibacterota bacterium]|nr:hypothetical protein [Candidatus Paceibacterota bacterium]
MATEKTVLERIAEEFVACKAVRKDAEQAIADSRQARRAPIELTGLVHAGKFFAAVAVATAKPE